MQNNDVVSASNDEVTSEPPPVKPKYERKQKIKQYRDKDPIPPNHSFTHFPYHPACRVCRACKQSREQHRAKRNKANKDEEPAIPAPTEFGQQITADHKILSKAEASRKGECVSLIIQDRFSKWLRAHAAHSKTALETMAGLLRFLPPQCRPEWIYTDGSLEFEKACKELRWRHDTCLPYTPQTNGIAERAVRKVKEGTSCLLSQSGLSPEWWSEAQECFCFLYCITEVMHDGFTPYQTRFLKDYKGKIIPFGAYVEFTPTTPADIKLLHEMGEKKLPGIFLGYHELAGGIESGWTHVALWHHFENATSARDIEPRKISAHTVDPIQRDGSFIFPLKEGLLIQPSPGQKRKLRQHSYVDWDAVDEDDEEEQDTVEDDIDEPKRDFPDTVADGHDELQPLPGCDDAASSPTHPENRDRWSIAGDYLVRHHVKPRKELYVPSEEDIPIPMKFLDVTRFTYTDLDSLSETTPTRELSSWWLGCTKFEILKPPPPPGKVWCNGSLVGKRASSKPPWIDPYEWSTRMSKAQQMKHIADWAVSGQVTQATWHFGTC